MFLTGPAVVQEVTGEAVSARDLGGPDVHRRNGVSHFVVDNDVDSIFLLRQLLGYLPQNTGEPPPSAAAADPDAPDPGGQVPLDPRKPYDMRDVVRGIVDAGSLLEVAPALGSQHRHRVRAHRGPAGRDRRQPAAAARRRDRRERVREGRASSSRTCNRFGLPLVVLVDTPGFLPGVRPGVARRHPARREAAARVRRARPSRASPSCCARRSAAPTSR